MKRIPRFVWPLLAAILLGIFFAGIALIHNQLRVNHEQQLLEQGSIIFDGGTSPTLLVRGNTDFTLPAGVIAAIGHFDGNSVHLRFELFSNGGKVTLPDGYFAVYTERYSGSMISHYIAQTEQIFGRTLRNAETIGMTVTYDINNVFYDNIAVTQPR